MAAQKLGMIGWLDLTVPDAGSISEFYQKVIGWNATPLSMGDYNDFLMTPPEGGGPTTGICHARGANAVLPPMWIPYFTVANAENSVTEATARGAELIKPIAPYGETGKWCVLRDPAGATFALFQH